MKGPSITSFFASLGRPVAYYPVFAKKLGGVNAAIMFSQISYWYKEDIKKEGEELYKTVADMEKETGLTRHEQGTAKRELVKRGVVTIEYKGAPPKTHFTVNWSVFEKLWEVECPDSRCSGNRLLEEPESGFSSITEITSKTTLREQSKDGYSPDFATFWTTYPRRLGKKKAYRCWLATLKRGAPAADLLFAAKKYASVCADMKTEERFIKHPATFLGPDEHWRDYLGTQKEQKPPIALTKCPKGHSMELGGICRECGYDAGNPF